MSQLVRTQSTEEQVSTANIVDFDTAIVSMYATATEYSKALTRGMLETECMAVERVRMHGGRAGQNAWAVERVRMYGGRAGRAGCLTSTMRGEEDFRPWYAPSAPLPRVTIIHSLSSPFSVRARRKSSEQWSEQIWPASSSLSSPVKRWRARAGEISVQ